MKRAIDCFVGQTYENKELIIVFPDDDSETRAMLAANSFENVKCVEVPGSPRMSVGMLRNISVRESSGEYFCQWDDDDWCHNSRLEEQMKAILLSHKPACVLAYWLMYDMVNHRSFFSFGPWPGTVLCKKSLFQSIGRYPDLDRREDTYFYQQLITHNCLFPLSMPFLYVYSYSGTNTSSPDHFSELFSGSQELSGHITSLLVKIFGNEMSFAEASALLPCGEVLKEINYFYNFFN